MAVTSLTFNIFSTYNGSAMGRARRDIQSTTNALSRLDKQSKTTRGGMRGIWVAAMAAAPAMVGLAKAATFAAGAFTAMAVGAGAAAGIFGGVMLAAAKRALDLEKAGRRLNSSQRAFVQSTHALTRAWNSFLDRTSGKTLAPLTIVMNGLRRGISRLIPLINAVHPIAMKVARAFSNWLVAENGLKRFIGVIVKYGVPALDRLQMAARHVLAFLGMGFRAFAPEGLKMAAVLERGARALRSWAAGGGFQRFIASARANMPIINAFFRALWGALRQVAIAMGGLAPVSLQLLTIMLRLVASLPIPVIQALLVAYLVWRVRTYALIAAQIAFGVAMAAARSGILGHRAAVLADAIASRINAAASRGSAGASLFQRAASIGAAAGARIKAVATWMSTRANWVNAASSFRTAIASRVAAVASFFSARGARASGLAAMFAGARMRMAAFASRIWAFATRFAAAALYFLRIRVIGTMFMVGLHRLRMMAATFATRAWAFATRMAAFTMSILRFRVLGAMIMTGLYRLRLIATTLATRAWAFATRLAAFMMGLLRLRTLQTMGMMLIYAARMTIVRIATFAWAAATRAYAAAQFLANLAMRLTPIGLLIMGIAALVAVIVWLATRTRFFQAVWRVVWAGVRAYGLFIWNLLKTYFRIFMAVMRTLMKIGMALLTGNWKRAWGLIRNSARVIWTLIRNGFRGFLNVMRAIGRFFMTAFRNSWRAFWFVCRAVARFVWAAIRNGFRGFLNVMRAIGRFFMTAFRNAWRGFWNAVRGIAVAIWNFLKRAWNAVKNFFLRVGRLLWAGIRGIFAAGSRWLRTTFWNPVKNFFTRTMPNAFKSAVKIIGKVWSALKKAISKPVKAVVDVVYNNGIVKLWNVVAGAFGAKKLGKFNFKGFREGGYTGNIGKNEVAGVVHGQEYVIPYEQLKAMGGPKAIGKMGPQALFAMQNGEFNNSMANMSSTNPGKNWVLDSMYKHTMGSVGGLPVGGDGPFDDFFGGIGDFFKKIGGGIKNAFSAVTGFSGGILKALGALDSCTVAEIANPLIQKVADTGKGVVNGVIPGAPWYQHLISGGKRAKKGAEGGGLKGAGMIQVAADAIKDWIAANADCASCGFNEFRPWKAGDGRRVGNLDVRTRAMLACARKAGLKASITQGSWSNASASAGTHSGGGAVDLSNPSDKNVGALRSCGFAAWNRGAKWGSPSFSPHIHAIAVGNKNLSPGAAAQVRDFKAGKNGLAGGGKDNFKDSSCSGKSGNCNSFRPLAAKALRANGINQNQLGRFMSLMKKESGCKTGAVNNWDSNARSGNASRGLMQVIPTTFRANHCPGTSNNIMDPYANICAAARYIKRRYGGRVPGSPYATGTRSASPGWHMVGERGPEMVRFAGGETVRTASQTRRATGAGVTAVLDKSKSSGGDVHVHIHGDVYAKSQLEFERMLSGALQNLKRKGRLPK